LSSSGLCPTMSVLALGDGDLVKLRHQTYENTERLVCLQVQCCVAASVSGGRHEDLLASRHGAGLLVIAEHCTRT
jgi:hypothetical protein